MSVATTLLTADELDQFPNDGKRREVIGGELHVSPAPTRTHQELVGLLHLPLFEAINRTKSGKVFVGPVDVRFSAHEQVQPDLVAIRQDRLGIYRGHIVHGAPDIVVEVLSPSTESYDRIEKKRLYETYGVPEYWIVDPKLHTVTIFRLTDGRYVEIEAEAGVFHSTAITGFTIDPTALFAEIMPE
jgi:Uma2 family endonuclease